MISVIILHNSLHISFKFLSSESCIHKPIIVTAVAIIGSIIRKPINVIGMHETSNPVSKIPIPPLRKSGSAYNMQNP